MTELDDIVNRLIDQTDPTQNADDLAAAITADQHVLLFDVRMPVLYDLTEAIALTSAALIADAGSALAHASSAWASS